MMPKDYFYYIAKLYGKNLLVILLSMTLSVAAIDYLKQAESIQNVGNQAILYFFYTWEFRFAQLYPLAIIFAAITSYMKLIGSNTFVSLYAFGYSRRQLFAPFVLPAILLYILLLFLQTGTFSYAREKAWSIAHHTQNMRMVKDLFFKHNQTFVYVKSLDPVRKVLTEVTIFVFRDGVLQENIILPYARFDGKYWVAMHATAIKKVYSDKGILDKIERRDLGRYSFLEGYKPKVIELIYEGESLSLVDTVNTYRILSEQNLDTSKIKATFYNKTLLPLLAFVMMIILFFKTPYYERQIRKDLLWLISLGASLLLWGLFYALFSLSRSGTVSPDNAMAIPVSILLIYTIGIYIRGEEKLR